MPLNPRIVTTRETIEFGSLTIIGSYPLLAFDGREASGAIARVYEIAGDVWITVNAKFESGAWLKDDTSRLSIAYVVSTNGDTRLMKATGAFATWQNLWAVRQDGTALVGADEVWHDGNTNGRVTTDKIADNAVTGAKLTDNSVTGNKLADNSVTGAKLADGAVTTVKIADNAVTGAKLADNSVTGVKLADNSVTGVKLADGAVTTAKIADDAVTGAKLADNSVTGVKLADGAVTSTKIADGAVTSSKVSDGAITTAKVADANITTAKVADSAITTAKIADGNVTTAKVADGAITSAKIADEAVTVAKVVSSLKRRSAVLVVPGDPAAGTGVSINLIMPTAGTVVNVKSTCRVAPTSTYTYDIMKNGSTIYTTTSNRPTRTSSDGTGAKTHATPDVTAFSAGDVFRVDLVTKGAGIQDTAFFIEYAVS